MFIFLFDNIIGYFHQHDPKIEKKIIDLGED